MSEETIISGKIARTLKGTSLVAQTGIKHLRYLHKKRKATQPDALKEQYESDIGTLLFTGLSQMRGTALKASQLLSLETDIIPERVRKELASSYYRVPPINKALIRKVFKQEFDSSPNELFLKFDSEAFAAASLGQVHKGEIQNVDGENTNVAVKVQYPGISVSIDSDLSILSVLVTTLAKTTNQLPNKNVIDTTLDEISTCLREEINYVQEAQNTQWFKENLKVINLKIPEVYSEYSTSRILTSEFLEGKHVDEWLETRPSQSERNKVGQTIFNTFLVSAFELRAVHADPHPGNYLFLEDAQVALLDFGCIKHLDEAFTESIASLMNAIITDNHKKIIESYVELGLFSNEIDIEEFYTQIQPALASLQQWMAAPFKASEFDFSTLPPVPSSAMQTQQKALVKHLHSVQRDQMYFDRTLIGTYLLLKKIGAVIGTENPWICASDTSTRAY